MLARTVQVGLFKVLCNSYSHVIMLTRDGELMLFSEKKKDQTLVSYEMKLINSIIDEGIHPYISRH